MIEIFQPIGLPEFKLSKTDLGDPLTLPYDISDDRKSEILNMLVYGFRDHNPRLLWVDWTEIDIKSGKISEIKDVKLDEETVLCISVKSENELEEVYKNLRWFKSLITVIDVRSKAAGKVNRKWLDKMKQTAYNAVRSAIFKRKVVDPKLFENFPFFIALKTFEDPIDVVEFFDRATRRLLDGTWAEIAAKDAIADILREKLSKLDVNELKSVLLFLKSEEMDDETIEGLEPKGFVRVYHGEMIPSQSLKALKDPRIMERSFGTIIDSIEDEGLRDDYKEFMATLEPLQGEPEPMMWMQDARDDMSVVVELWDIESELSGMGLPEEMLNDPEKLIETENKILLVESDESVRSKALVFRAFGYLGTGDVRRAEGDMENACGADPEMIRNSSALFFKIGDVYLNAGRYRDARRVYLRVLEISKRIGYGEGTATSVHGLGDIHYLQGRYDEAVAKYQESLKISEELGNRNGIAGTLHQLGNVHYEQGRYDEAVTMYQESLKIKEELGDRRGIASTLHQLGMIYQRQDRYDEAVAKYQESLKISEELGNRNGIASTLGQMGRIFHAQNNYKEALRCYLNASAIFHELDSPYKDLAGQLIATLKEEVGDTLFDKYYEEVTADE
jgi:tetratricopeptide (TPR) repeat protein